jgi:glycosyltransferase involved in cell wall biosynthesis
VKVALVLPGFSAHERDWCIPVLLDYVRALSRTDEVHVFTLRWPERRARYAVFGADVRALGGTARLGPRVVGLWARALSAIAAEHWRRPFDVVHAFWADEPGWVAALAAAWLGRPMLLSLAGGELVGLRDIGYGLQTLPGRRALVRWLMQRATLVTGGSDYLLAQAREQLPPNRAPRLRRASLGVDLERFAPPANGQEPARAIGLNVGALYPVKDQARLLCVAARVPGLTLRIAGQGPLLAPLQALAAKLGLDGRAEFLGPVDHAALPGVYAAADVFVQTSRHEAQGMALLEAAACGVPAAGTPVGVLPELGLPASTEAELAETLTSLLADAPRRQARGEAARQCVREKFSLEGAMAHFRALYAELADTPQA